MTNALVGHRKGEEDRVTQGRKAETGFMPLQIKDCLEATEAGKGRKKSPCSFWRKDIWSC
jgi:hypothetical protein